MYFRLRDVPCLDGIGIETHGCFSVEVGSDFKGQLLSYCNWETSHRLINGLVV